MPGIAATVFSFQNFVKAVDDKNFREVRCLLQISEQVVTFRVDVGCSVMRDLPGRVTEAHSLVVDGGAHPNGAAVLVSKFGAPETHVVPLARIISDGLFECQVFFSSPEVEAADGGGVIWSLEH